MFGYESLRPQVGTIQVSGRDTRPADTQLAWNTRRYRPRFVIQHVQTGVCGPMRYGEGCGGLWPPKAFAGARQRVGGSAGQTAPPVSFSRSCRAKPMGTVSRPANGAVEVGRKRRCLRWPVAVHEPTRTSGCKDTLRRGEIQLLAADHHGVQLPERGRPFARDQVEQ